jgi:hypothetical protein
MKTITKLIYLAFTVVILAIGVSCASSPEVTTTTTRQTTADVAAGTTATHAPGGANLVGTIHQGTTSQGY